MALSLVLKKKKMMIFAAWAWMNSIIVLRIRKLGLSKPLQFQHKIFVGTESTIVWVGCNQSPLSPLEKEYQWGKTTTGLGEEPPIRLLGNMNWAKRLSMGKSKSLTQTTTEENDGSECLRLPMKQGSSLRSCWKSSRDSNLTLKKFKS